MNTEVHPVQILPAWAVAFILLVIELIEIRNAIYRFVSSWHEDHSVNGIYFWNAPKTVLYHFRRTTGHAT